MTSADRSPDANASLRHSAAVAVPGSGVAKPITAAPL